MPGIEWRHNRERLLLPIVILPGYNSPNPSASLSTEGLLDTGATGTGIRRDIYELQASMGDLPEVDCPLQHSFIDGVYVRTIFIPAGTVLVGKIHKHAHANILSAGDVSVMTESGGIERLTGPLTMVSAPGTKRAVYAHADTTWTTIHPTDATDLDQIEADVIAPTFEDYERFALRGNSMKNIEVMA